ncbi:MULTISPECIES: helix-turn-helix domain-containing protein [unclassified Streptomyces]|uniref:helix-turn-helix domain-containing protein n=1 Tax=unclassified Streptomyces TaxID=2593676 RepID=UPI00380E13F5
MTQSTADTNDTDDVMPSLPNPKERRRLREAKSLSEQQVATAVGVTQATVRSWEKGRSTPRGRRLESYARLLATIEAEMATVADRTAMDEPAEAAGTDGTDGTETDGTSKTRETSATSATSEICGAERGAPTHPTHDEDHRADLPPIDTDDKRRGPARPANPTDDKKQGPARPGDCTDGEEPTAARPFSPAARVQPPATGHAKPPAKPHAANTRPKPAAKRASKPPATPHARHDHPAPAAPAPVPEPAKALKTGALTGASALPGTASRTLPEHPDHPERSDAQPDGAEADAHRSGTPPKARSPLPSTEPAPERAEPATGLTPAEAFDALYVSTAPALARQAYLLTGRTRLSRESVERAFHLAWENWPEVATDRDPAGWVRAAAYEYALAPWHRFRRARKRPDQPPAEPERRALLDALLDLPPVYRRTLLLYDGVGLDLPETAAETEASTPAAANRLLHARAAIARRVPAVAGAADSQALSATMRERLADLALAEPASVTRLPSASVVRIGGERRRQFWTRAAIAFTALIVGATAFTVVTVPPYHVRPVPVGERVGGVPVNSGPQLLSVEDLELRDKLRQEPAHGPERLVVEIR